MDNQNTELNDSNEDIEEKHNKNNVRCKYCNSLILKNNIGKFIEKKYNLPLMQQKKQVNEIETEEFSQFWCVSNIFEFENIAFTNKIDQTKFLCCADCDMGPVGYHEIDTQNSYIALDRVKSESSD